MTAIRIKPWYSPGSIFITFVVVSILLFSYTEGTNQYPKLVVFCLIVFSIINILFMGRSFKLNIEYYLLFAWMLIGSMSTTTALDSDIAITKLFTLFTVIPMALAFFYFATWYESPRNIWAGIFIGTLIMSYLSLHQGPTYGGEGRLTGTLGNANHFGYMLVISLIIIFYAFFSFKNRLLKSVVVAMGAVLVYFIAFTGSKQALFGMFLVMLIYAIIKMNFHNLRRTLKSMVLMLLFTTIIVSAFIFVSNTPYFNRATEFMESVTHGKMGKTSSTGNTSTIKRYLFYVYGFDIAVKHPGLGVGLDNFRVAIKEYPGFMFYNMGTYAHSNYIELMADTGFIGFILYMGIYIVLGMRLLRFRKQPLEAAEQELYHAMIVFYFFVLASDFFRVSYYDKISWIVLSSVIATTQLLERRQNNCLNE